MKKFLAGSIFFLSIITFLSAGEPIERRGAEADDKTFAEYVIENPPLKMHEATVDLRGQIITGANKFPDEPYKVADSYWKIFEAHGKKSKWYPLAKFLPRAVRGSEAALANASQET